MSFANADEKWKRLSNEAVQLQQFELACKYFAELVALSSSAEVWCEYGTLCMRAKDYVKAEQAFREALTLDMAHWKTLIFFGILLTMKKQLREAEVFLQAAADVEPHNFVCWGVLVRNYNIYITSNSHTILSNVKRNQKLCSACNIAKKCLLPTNRQIQQH